MIYDTLKNCTLYWSNTDCICFAIIMETINLANGLYMHLSTSNTKNNSMIMSKIIEEWSMRLNYLSNVNFRYDDDTIINIKYIIIFLLLSNYVRVHFNLFFILYFI